MDKLENMETFIKIVETGSISSAAERLSIAKSAVSRRLNDLENQLGVELFHRTTRSLNLTDTGKSYYARVIQILDDVLETEISVAQEHHELKGGVKVALPATFGNLHVSSALNEFVDMHPGITLNLDYSDRHVDLIAEGFDLAIRITDLADSSLIARKLAKAKRIFCASPAYIEQYGAPSNPSELSDHKTVVYSREQIPDTWKLIDKSNKEFRVKVSPVFRATSGEALRDFAVADKGITFLPTFIIHKQLESGQLVQILEDYRTPEVNIFALYPQTRHLCGRVRALIDFLAERFAGTPYWDEAI